MWPLTLLLVLGCQTGSPGATSSSGVKNSLGGFEELNRKYAEMTLGEVGSDYDVKRFDALSNATDELWTKFPERRSEFMRPWLNTAKGDNTRKALLLGKLLKADWQKDISATERSQLEALVCDVIKIDRTNAIVDLCKIAVNQKLKKATPSLEIASATRKPGANKNTIDDAIKTLSALKY